MKPPQSIFRHQRQDLEGFKSDTPSYLAFAWAYRQSAAALAAAFEKGDEIQLAAPIVFLYRHALEVCLKGILIEFGGDYKISKDAVLKRSHGLDDQLPDLRTVAEGVGMEVSEELEHYVNKMHQFDPNSQHWRYPEVKGTASKGTEEFDVRTFVRTSEAAFEELCEIANRLSTDRYNEILREEGVNH